MSERSIGVGSNLDPLAGPNVSCGLPRDALLTRTSSRLARVAFVLYGSFFRAGMLARFFDV